MKRFLFPLERVRRWRSEQADVEELKLGQLQERLAALNADKRSIAIECDGAGRAVLGQVRIEAYEVQSLEAYRKHVANQIRDMETQERECRAAINQQRQRVIAARQSAQLLDRLKQDAFEGWRVVNDREEEALAAELFLAKRPRRAKAAMRL